MDNSTRIEQMKQRLTAELSPTHLEISDDSHLHAGHAGAKSGKGHFTVTIASAQFAGKRSLLCHQMIYQALGDMMTTDIHALAIKVVD
ncbi:BolA family protein [Pleionea litopenaei]|uniref:BolA family protein n=1 Tax=Pleionea litopenaei TaxID=3070815 RepID=A0AA51RTA3_9GAMM|nr:BolA family protein [Pleionea sp. HL-JVS1]WMS87195.1 BolA family protein [Pleionea sp. HL-JVS1]